MIKKTSILSSLTDILEKYDLQEGINETFLENVTLFKVSAPSPKAPLIYDQCICIALQGQKKCYLTDRIFTYGKDSILVVPTIAPIEIEVFPEGDKPLYGLTISLDFKEIQDIVESIIRYNDGYKEKLSGAPGIYLEDMTTQLAETSLRLLQSIRSKSEAHILGNQIVRELYYHLLIGNNGNILASAAFGESRYAQIAKSLRSIHDHYSDPIDIPDLAGQANMSVRSFYTHFKEITSLTPVQYLKRIRLEKARQLIANQGKQANSAAHMVGYESPSQFSREFKKHFGFTPREALKKSPLTPVQPLDTVI